MWVVPLAASLLAFAFAGLLGRDLLARRKAYLGLWTVALAMYGVASMALFLATVSRWTPAGFRLYWVLGAVLNVPFLALGELYLLVRSRAATAVLLVVLVFGSAFAIARVARAPVDVQFLLEDLPSGREVFGEGSDAYALARLYSLPAYAVLVVGTLWSALGLIRRRAPRERFLGVLAIAVGATVVAAGAAFAVRGNLPGFSLTLAGGVAAMFWGFLLASRAPVPAVPAPSPAA